MATTWFDMENATSIEMIIAAAAVVTGERLPVLLSRTRAVTGPRGEPHGGRARRIAQVAALQAGYSPVAVAAAFGRDRSTIVGRPGSVDGVLVEHRDAINAILAKAEQFAAMPREQVGRIVDAVGRVALPPEITGAGARVAVPARVSTPYGSVLRAVA